MIDQTPEPTPPPPVVKRRRKIRNDVRIRAERTWEARVAGATWAQAAEIGGYAHRANARRAVQQVYGTLPCADRDELRDLWRDRLELLWRQAVRDVLDQKPGAVTSAVRVVTAAANLDGLNEPIEVHAHLSATFAQVLREIEGTGVYGEVVDAS